MKKYYISLRPFSDGHYIIHSHDCPFLSESGRYMFLGVFETKHEAFDKGRKYFTTLAFCRFCNYEGKYRKSDPISKRNPESCFITSKQLCQPLKT